MSAPVMTKEVTQGTFDPRTYKQVDKAGWAKKRKPEWMATTGQIHFTRERTVASQEREEAKVPEVEEEKVPEKVVAPVVVEKVKAPVVQWAGRRRSDITRGAYLCPSVST